MKIRVHPWRLVLFAGAHSLLLFLAGCRPSASNSVLEQDHSSDERWQGRLVLGSASLTAGIPGEGPLKPAEIRRWLADPANHKPLDVALPLGLRGDAAAIPLPPDNPLTRAKIELGRQLFFEHRLSRGTILACSDCHQPLFQFTSDEIANPGLRETAVAFNRIFGREQFWDGRATSLEDQVHFPLESTAEMNSTPAEAAERIAAIEGHRLQFEAIFGDVSFDNIAKALAAFERTIVTGPSSWDYDQERERLEAKPPAELTSDERALLAAARDALARRPFSQSARRGGELFFSERTRCSECHSGPNFSDEQYHDIGLRPTAYKLRQGGEFADDMGRFRVTQREADRYAFKTPTLRNIALTRPYMHDGRFRRLEETIDFFVRGGDSTTSELSPLDLSLDDKRDLLEFLRSLTGELPKVESGRLPE